MQWKSRQLDAFLSLPASSQALRAKNSCPDNGNSPASEGPVQGQRSLPALRIVDAVWTIADFQREIAAELAQISLLQAFHGMRSPELCATFTAAGRSIRNGRFVASMISIIGSEESNFMP
jgi:hypothetical protein